MPLKARVSSVEDLDEAIRGFYVEAEGGGYVLDVEKTEGYGLGNISGLERTLGDWKAKHQKSQGRLKEFEGLDPEEARTAIEGKGKAATKSSEIEALKRALKESEAQRELSAAQVRNLSLTSEIDRQIAQHKALPVLRDVLTSQKAFSLENDDAGNPVPVVLDGDGQTRMTIREGSAYRTTIAEKFAELAKDENFAPFFPGSGASGSGARGGGEGGGAVTTKSVGWNDPIAFSDNLDAIATGKVEVTPPIE